MAIAHAARLCARQLATHSRWQLLRMTVLCTEDCAVLVGDAGHGGGGATSRLEGGGHRALPPSARPARDPALLFTAGANPLPAALARFLAICPTSGARPRPLTAPTDHYTSASRICRSLLYSACLSQTARSWRRRPRGRLIWSLTPVLFRLRFQLYIHNLSSICSATCLVSGKRHSVAWSPTSSPSPPLSTLKRSSYVAGE